MCLRKNVFDQCRSSWLNHANQKRFKQTVKLHAKCSFRGFFSFFFFTSQGLDRLCGFGIIFIVTTPLVSFCMERLEQLVDGCLINNEIFEHGVRARIAWLTRIFWSWSTVWFATLFPLISAISSPSCKDPEEKKTGATNVFEVEDICENHHVNVKIQKTFDVRDVILI